VRFGRKARNKLPPSPLNKNPAPHTMHSPTLTIDFSSCLTLGFTSVHSLPSPRSPFLSVKLAFSDACALFFSLCARFRPRVVYFQWLAASFCKIPGYGYSERSYGTPNWPDKYRAGIPHGAQAPRCSGRLFDPGWTLPLQVRDEEKRGGNGDGIFEQGYIQVACP
jgi:hypothetical protein